VAQCAYDTDEISLVESESDALAAEETYAAANSSVLKCALKVVMVAELFVTGLEIERFRHLVRAMMLKLYLDVLDWKLSLLS